MRALSSCVVVIGMVFATGPAAGAVAYIDEFTIFKNGNLFFHDPFADGIQPPSAPDFPNGTPASYAVNGTLVPNSETAGKLRVNSSDGATIITSNGLANSSLGVILLSNTDPANLVNGLKIDDTFSVTAIFDLVTNGGPRYSGYGIGVNDAGNGLGRRNETNLQVAYSEGLGIEVIRLSYQDFDNGTNTTLAFLPVAAPAGTDQISLSLTRGDINSLNLIASFAYLDNGQVVGAGTLGAAGSAFQDRNWVRALFFSAESQLVSEPGTLSLLGLTLACLAAIRVPRARALRK